MTAQKREQSLQDVPVAITALSQTALQTNRITSINDLGSIAPNVTFMANRSNNAPQIVMRGELVTAPFPGQDTALPIYLDGVWLGGTLGTALELPDIERIEVLRGPQGTLFGRNSTAGAISIITADPAGEFDARSTISVGNYDQFRTSTRIDTPQFGPFSASISYTHNERRGDVRNLGAGTVWDRTSDISGQGVAVSPEWLGSSNKESVFAQLKFEPSDSFKMVYKFDWMDSEFTPEANGILQFTPESMGSPFGDLIASMYADNPFPLSGLHRPDAINADWATLSKQRAHGHNLTATYDITDQLSIKNVFGLRKNSLYSNFAQGMGGLKVNAAYAGFLELISGVPAGTFDSLIGESYRIFDASVVSTAKQWSDELQINYSSDLVTVTAGALYVHVRTTFGGEPGQASTQALAIIPGGVIPQGPLADATNRALNKSLAGYTQVELHATDSLDLIGGIRLTNDKKSTSTDGVTANTSKYSDTRLSYSLGVNYKINPDVLVYGKYANAYVSGGNLSGLDFAPTVVDSWELGFKGDLLDRRVRLNVALFKADYTDEQFATACFNIGITTGVTCIGSAGDLKTKGFEGEITATPLEGLTLNGSVGYTDMKLKNINPLLTASGPYVLARRPDWTANLGATYETLPLFDDTTLMFRLSGTYHSAYNNFEYQPIPAAYQGVATTPSEWVVNARATLRNIALGDHTVDVSAWVMNLGDADGPVAPGGISFSTPNTPLFAVGSYTPARTFGVDLTFNY
ncbi:TonB-dependent receptor [Novosphingobium malaysiense]|uniref:TonB-dependent receptor n=1 Tax=Novosphingobium malaysiense TaxID=1348853 RepID=A0A0B1ZM33_9SPHN|nr:TonB-dependent receptor [Novosphingobium malaysiense]KHK90345.1 hypothetical protein LK12_17235 [Novosphingobium malaysiense]